MVIVHTCKYIILKGMVVIKINSGAIIYKTRRKERHLWDVLIAPHQYKVLVQDGSNIKIK
jgi:hypothetical protein